MLTNRNQTIEGGGCTMIQTNGPFIRGRKKRLFEGLQVFSQEDLKILHFGSPKKGQMEINCMKIEVENYGSKFGSSKVEENTHNRVGKSTD